MDECKPHAVLVPGPGLGHVNACLLLAKALVSAGFRVTVVCFERAYQTNKARMDVSHLPVHLEIVADGLPPLPTPSYPDLFHVTPSMHQNLLLLLQSLSTPATCLISHSFMAWTQHVADLVGIPRVDYWTSNATSFFNLCYDRGLESSSDEVVNSTFEECIQNVGRFPVNEVFKDYDKALLEENPLLQRLLDISHLAKNADCVLVQSVYELEREAFEALKNLIHINVLPVAPLFHHYDNVTSTNSTNTTTLKWLDAHVPLSVIFVSFGSNFVYTHHEVVELAHGLEASGKSFLWVIHSDAIEQKCELDVVLPHGFKERIATRGLIMPWVSQLSILAHPAVGGFLSHCGWNSTLESIWMGVPMLTCPKGAEQPVNNWLISKSWGSGIELETSSSKTFSRDQVKIGICNLLDETVGVQARAKAKELSHVLRKAPFEGGNSHSNFLKFVSKMKKQCLKQAEG